MYCSVCKLRVADDSVVICPVCQGALQPESEAGENPEADGFVDELAAVFEQGPEPDIKLEDKLDAYVRDDTNLDFDPEVLGLKSTEEDELEASAEDIKVLADLWEKEDIGADLDGVFAEAFNLEEVAPESPVVDQGSMKPEKVAPESPVMPIPEISTPAPAENSRNLGFPLLIFIVLLAAGGLAAPPPNGFAAGGLTPPPNGFTAGGATGACGIGLAGFIGLALLSPSAASSVVTTSSTCNMGNSRWVS